jgi:hypothetical protein
MPSIHDRAAVDRDDVTLAQYPWAWDAMDDLVVDRCTDRCRVGAVVALERRHRTAVPDVLLGDRVERRSRHAGSDSAAQHLEGPAHDQAGLAHLGDLRLGLQLDHFILLA